jgi:hypothetical protein
LEIFAVDIPKADGQQCLNSPVERHTVPQHVVVCIVICGIVFLNAAESTVPCICLALDPTIFREIGQFGKKEPKACYKMSDKKNSRDNLSYRRDSGR